VIIYQLPYGAAADGLGQLIVNRTAKFRNKRKQTLVPCFPLETLLASLNRSRVDYFSLDIEGLELHILKTIDWTRVNISILSVEFLIGKVCQFLADHTVTGLLAT